MKFNFGKGLSLEKTPLGPACWFGTVLEKTAAALEKAAAALEKAAAALEKVAAALEKVAAALTREQQLSLQVQRNLLLHIPEVCWKNGSCIVWVWNVFFLICFLISFLIFAVKTYLFLFDFCLQKIKLRKLISQPLKSNLLIVIKKRCSGWDVLCATLQYKVVLGRALCELCSTK